MPKITILEKDLTTAGASELLSNIVYVPGYAITGPVNKPTLCRTLDEFKETFGSVPYKFLNNQTYSSSSSKTYAYAGDYEKSYIYAAELINRGLPILFERYMNTANITNFTAKSTVSTTDSKTLTISAVYPGRYNEGIKCTFSPSYIVLENDITITDEKSTLYKGSELTDGSIVNGESSLGKLNESKALSKNDIIKAKSKIALGSNLNGTLYTVDDYIVTVTKGAQELSEITLSFNPASDNFYTKIKNDYIKFTSNDLLTNITLNLSEATEYILEISDKTTDEFTVADLYGAMKGNYTTSETITKSIFEKIADNKDVYNVKTITSGSYPTFLSDDKSIASNMVQVAANCGDALAVIDHENNYENLYEDINKDWTSATDNSGDDAKKYAAMFTPWATYITNTTASYLANNLINMPASFAYVNSLANSIKINPNWYAIAGVTRGNVPGLIQVDEEITGSTSDKYQSKNGVSINPIMNVPSYGYCIWGNRTLHNNKGLVASSFLNIRALTNDIKKVVYQASKELTFELNNDVTWLNFRSKIEPTLDKMVTGNGINGYKLIRATSDKKATIKAIIRIYPIEAVEDFDITIELADSFTTAE